MKYAQERYIRVRHPHRIGEELIAIPTGKTRTENGTREALVKILTPKAGIAELWIKRNDLIE